MDTKKLEKFAQNARRQLREQVAARMEQVLSTDSAEMREREKAIAELKRQIAASSRGAVVDRVAYTWFNRLCALRFMDANHYTRVGVVSPQEGFTQPEILQEAKQGIIDEALKVDRRRVQGLLDGQLPSSNPQQEAYRLLLVGVCNYYHKSMPFLFQPIEDYTELLMPEDLLSENSFLHAVRSALHEDACQDVEVIGWLYQFYISERKDEVIGSKKKIQPEDIPAATQLFTPHWIVRYLVENSLGRLWMLNHPDSAMIEHMDFYIQQEQEETDCLEVSSPEEIKVCDPACGSGHMLTYAFDLLYGIYTEQGYDPVRISSLILEKNLYGIEIDERAGALAAFALTMKAREKDRRFFQREVEPNICVLENVKFTDKELDEYMDAVGRDLFSERLKFTLRQFEHAKNFGSLIRPQSQDLSFLRNQLEGKGIFQDLLLFNTNLKVQRVLKQAEYLSENYHVVVANPPYMGNRNINQDLKEFAKYHYKNSKSDLYTMFIERNLALLIKRGYIAMITIPSWMFLSSYEKLRDKLLSETTIISLNHNGRGVWGSDFGSCSFVIKKRFNQYFEGVFKRLFTEQGKVASNQTLIRRFHNHKSYPIYRASSFDFKKIPGEPIAYWVSGQTRRIFENYQSLSSYAEPRKGMVTADVSRFVRYWFEVPRRKIGYGCSSRKEAAESNCKWFPYMKGGNFRRWSGNNENVVNWENDGYELLHMKEEGYKVGSTNHNLEYIFKPAITWTTVTSSDSGFRLNMEGYLFDTASGLCPVNDLSNLYKILGLLNTPITTYLLRALNPTLNLNSGNLRDLPYKENVPDKINRIVRSCIEISNTDWNSYETSWDFTVFPLLHSDHQCAKLEPTYTTLRNHWQEMTLHMQRLEEENNNIFIKGYDLESELTPEVPLQEISLNSNPYYRYPSTNRNDHTNEEREARLLEDTMKEFINYAVGCMFGRYSLDKPGLILANQGETIRHYLKQVSNPTFPPDEDNVIPILDEGWFADDIAERFKRFLRGTFGEEHYEENLAFLEDAIGRDIRSYFLKDFYDEHVKMYQKRPIYWLFSSPNGSFNALIYMHRYRPDTLSVVLNDYLREYRQKLSAHRTHLEAVNASPSASQREKTKALKEIEQLNKVLAELKEYEDEVLYPLASRQMEIDLDDGVKVNYNKFGGALKKVSGLSEN